MDCEYLKTLVSDVIDELEENILRCEEQERYFKSQQLITSAIASRSMATAYREAISIINKLSNES